jgi:hypothetical protein
VRRRDRFILDFGRSSADYAVRRNGIAGKHREGIMGSNSCGKPDSSTIIKCPSQDRQFCVSSVEAPNVEIAQKDHFGIDTIDKGPHHERTDF